MVVDLASYRENAVEQARLGNLMEVLPRGRRSILDAGARDGYISGMLTSRFAMVTALDIRKPVFRIEGVFAVQGDVTELTFPDNTFDVVLCAEVLEHLREPLLARACRELARVARHEVVIGVPYRQDLRVGRTTCASCKEKNPPWGHMNRFDESRLKALFRPLCLVATSLVGPESPITNTLSSLLMDLAGNPWGTYDQEEPCVHCGESLVRPVHRSVLQKACSQASVLLTAVQNQLLRPSPMWIHTVFAKTG